MMIIINDFFKAVTGFLVRCSLEVKAKLITAAFCLLVPNQGH